MRIHLFSTDNFSNLIFYNQTHNPSVEDKFSRMCIFQCSFAKPVTNAQLPLITNTIFSLCENRDNSLGIMTEKKQQEIVTVLKK